MLANSRVYIVDDDGNVISPATEGGQTNIVDAIKDSTGFQIPLYDTQVIEESDPASVVITYKLSGVTVATKTIVTAGTTTTITVT